VFLFPLFAQGILHFTPTETGLVMLPGGLATAASAMICGILLNGKNPKADPRVLIFCGVLLFAASMWMMGHLTTAAGESDVRAALLVRGFGLGLLFVPINSAAYASIKPQEAQQASGLINLSRQLGGAFGIAVLLNQLSKTTQNFRVDLVGTVTSGSVLTEERLQLLTRGFQARGMDLQTAHQSALAAINGQLQQQASMLGFNDAWIFILVVFLLVSPSILLLGKPKRGQPAAAVDAH
jgi:DHA2 family multidrug resistance protein